MIRHPPGKSVSSSTDAISSTLGPYGRKGKMWILGLEHCNRVGIFCLYLPALARFGRYGNERLFLLGCLYNQFCFFYWHQYGRDIDFRHIAFDRGRMASAHHTHGGRDYSCLPFLSQVQWSLSIWAGRTDFFIHSDMDVSSRPFFGTFFL